MSVPVATPAPITGLSLTPDPNPAQMPTMPPATMATPQFDPQQLADIHLPDSISYWPIAPGWWIVAALMLILLIATLLWQKNRHSRRFLNHNQRVKLLKSQAQNELKAIYSDYKNHNNAHESTRQLSVFLRRYALSLYPREKIASVIDEQWLQQLDKLSGSDQYSKKFAQLLTAVPYQAEHKSIDKQLLSELFVAAKQLVQTAHRETDHV